MRPKSLMQLENRFSLHMQSASGGLASVFYEYAASKQMWFAGVFLDDKFEAHFRLTKIWKKFPNFGILNIRLALLVPYIVK